MFDLAKDQTTVNERAILRKLRVWIIALATACLLAGIGVGAMLSGDPQLRKMKCRLRAHRKRCPPRLPRLPDVSNRPWLTLTP